MKREPASASTRCRLLALCVALGFWLAPSAVAAQASCTVSASGVAFGSVAARDGTWIDSVGRITVTCRGAVGQAVRYRIRLLGVTGGTLRAVGAGTGSSGLGYALYIDTARTVPWGDGSVGTSTVMDSYALASIGETRTYNVHGRLFPASSSVAGRFASSVGVVLDY